MEELLGVQPKNVKQMHQKIQRIILTMKSYVLLPIVWQWHKFVLVLLYACNDSFNKTNIENIEVITVLLTIGFIYTTVCFSKDTTWVKLEKSCWECWFIMKAYTWDQTRIKSFPVCISYFYLFIARFLDEGFITMIIVPLNRINE